MATPTTLPATFVAGNVLTAAQMNDLRGAFRILQVVQTTKTDTFSASNGTTPTDITGMTVTITPSATSSGVLIIVNLSISANTSMAFNLVRGSTTVFVGDTAGSRRRVSSNFVRGNDAAASAGNFPLVFMDTPSTTSATTYKLQAVGDQAGSVVYVNRGSTDTDAVGSSRSASSILALEISA